MFRRKGCSAEFAQTLYGPELHANSNQTRGFSENGGAKVLDGWAHYVQASTDPLTLVHGKLTAIVVDDGLLDSRPTERGGTITLLSRLQNRGSAEPQGEIARRAALVATTFLCVYSL